MSRPLLLAALSVGCAPATVDTVQPNAVAKAVFEGEWFWRDTVAEVPYGTAATFTGAQSQLERIRWQVEEDLLLGYRSYEHVDAADAPTGTDIQDGLYFGAPLVAYAIEKHFDIRRAYDRSTGEESNVVEENVERPWHDRDYMRVDWSTNLAEAGWTLAGVPLKVLDFAQRDPAGAGAPRFDDSDGDGVIDSLLLTSEVLAAPDTVRLPGYGDVPVCLFYGQAQYACDASQVSILSSFSRVDGARDYLGEVYDDHHMETFGFFETMRLSYDAAYGLAEANRSFWINRHNLWEQAIVREDGAPWCRARGEQGPCDGFSVADDPKPLKVPYAERTVRPIAYHAGPDFEPDLVEATASAIAAWNVPLRDAVNGLRFWECLDGGGRKKKCDDWIDPDLQVMVFCPHNPSLPTDPAACNTDHTGPLGRPDGVPDVAEVGDLRYHFVQLVDNPQIRSPFGYGPSAADPAGRSVALADGVLGTGAGEIVSGNAFVYRHVLDRVATLTADLVALLNGDIAPDAFVEGENVQAWVDALGSGGLDQLVGADPALDEASIADRLGRMRNGFAPAVAQQLAALPRPERPEDVDAFLDAAGATLDASGIFGAGAAESMQRWEALVASPHDDLLWSDETVGAYGFDPVAMLAGDVSALDGRSPLDLVHPANEAEREYWRVLAGQHAVDLDDGAFADASLVGMARRYHDLGWSWEAVRDDVRRELYEAVVEHEIGHTLGLRHNFAASFDALNFDPTYWDLRKDGHMAPRHVDPETEAELTAGIREHQYSSVMDYGGSLNGDWHGLGHWDEAAIKFGYANLVEVLDAVPTAAAVPGLPNVDALGYASVYASSTVYPTVVLWRGDGSMLELHYTDYPAIAGDLEARVDVPLRRLEARGEDPGFAGRLVVRDAVAGVVEAGAPVVPYRFCSDEFATGMTCARWDEGADPWEVQQFLTQRYWNHYLLDNFQRGRYGFGDAASYVGRLNERVFRPLRTWQRYYALFHGIFGAETDPQVADWFVAPRGFGAWTAATDESFRFLTRVITRPEPGPHARVERPDGVSHYAPTYGEGAFEIPLVSGAWYESRWDVASGYHWFDRQSRIGTYWDRMLALLALTSTESYGFIGYDTRADPRAYAIGYQDLYRDAIALFLGQLMADDASAVGPVRAADGTLSYPDTTDVGRTWPPPDADLVRPATFWLIAYDAGLFGKALLARGYDRSFLNRSRIYVEGGADAIAVPEGQATVSFTDPSSGKTLTAWSFPAVDGDGAVVVDGVGDPVELGSGARMIRQAHTLLERCDTDEAACAELEGFAGDLELQVQLQRTFEGQLP